jgi:hypothetical protein
MITNKLLVITLVDVANGSITIYILVINNDISGVKLNISTIKGTIINTVPPGTPAPENFVTINKKANSGIFSVGREKPKIFNTIKMGL